MSLLPCLLELKTVYTPTSTDAALRRKNVNAPGAFAAYTDINFP